MPDNFHYLYQHCRHESDPYDLTECCQSRSATLNTLCSPGMKITSASKETPAVKA